MSFLSHSFEIRSKYSRDCFQEVRQILLHEGGQWLFAFKATGAALLALWISFRFQLSQPVTAVVTVFLLMQPQSGPVLTKSIYRLLGTLCGAVVALVLFALFPQEPYCFHLGLALWIGVCTAGATLYRNFVCYAFVLAGYTAAMIGMANVAHPSGFFYYAVGRTSEVLVGIFCSALVSDLIFPQHLGKPIKATSHAAYEQFTGFIHLVLTDPEKARGYRSKFLSFINYILTLESLRCSAYWEATSQKSRHLALGRLNAELMAVTTAAYSLQQFLLRLNKSRTLESDNLSLLLSSLDEQVFGKEGSLIGADHARSHLAHLQSFFQRYLLSPMQRQREVNLAEQETNTAALDAGMYLVEDLTLHWHTFLECYAALHSSHGLYRGTESFGFSPRTDPLIASLNGIRAALAVICVALFWIATAWPYGNYAVMMVAIACSLFAPLPAPIFAINMGLYGGLLALPLAFGCKFFLLPSINGYSLLVAMLGPILLVSAWLMGLSKKTMMFGLGFCCMFCFMLTPTNSMVYDPVQMMNFGLSQVGGQAAASLMFYLFFPINTPWLKRRIPMMTRRQMAIACRAPLAGIEAKFESGTRDIMQRIAAMGGEEESDAQIALDWMFIVLEIGGVVIQLRQVRSERVATALEQKIKSIIEHLEALFAVPCDTKRKALIGEIEQTIRFIITFRDVQKSSNDQNFPKVVSALLHTLNIILLDSEPIFTGSVPHATRTCPV